MNFRFLALTLVWVTTQALVPLNASGRAEGSIQKTWDYPEGIRHLVIEVEGQDVVLTTGGSRLKGQLVGNVDDVLTLTQKDDTLTLVVRTSPHWFSWNRTPSRIEVSFPPRISLDITTASGNVQVLGPTQGLRVRSKSGNLEAAQGGSSANVDSASGAIRLVAFTGPTQASSLSGNVLLDDLSGEIQASTVSGNLQVSRLNSDKSRFATVSGNVDLKLLRGLQAYQIQAETVSGALVIGDKTGEHRIAIGTSGPLLFVKSVSGNVRVK